MARNFSPHRSPRHWPISPVEINKMQKTAAAGFTAQDILRMGEDEPPVVDAGNVDD